MHSPKKHGHTPPSSAQPTLRLAGVCLALLIAGPVSAYPNSVTPSLPGSYSYECTDCHISASCSPSSHPQSPCLDPFGTAYLQSGWSSALGAADQDGDGVANGTELSGSGSPGIPIGAEAACNIATCASAPGSWLACSGWVRCLAIYSATPANNYTFSFSCSPGTSPSPTHDDTSWTNNCLDVDECAGNPCGAGNCNELPIPSWVAPGYTCTCESGYEASGGTCLNIDECALGTHTCSPHQFCTDTDGGFECTPDGPAVPGVGGLATGLFACVIGMSAAWHLAARRES